jgi:putative inorganic carbon (hco3(-)) transporter
MTSGAHPNVGHKRRLERAGVWLATAAAVAPLCSIAASQTLLGASFLCLALARASFRFPPVKLPLFLFLGGTTASWLLSGHIQQGWPQIRKFYLFIFVLLCVATALREIGSLLRLAYWWVATATCSALWGLVQFARTLRASLGAGGNLYFDLVSDRITGFMSLWMTFAGQLMIVLLVLGGLLLFAPEKARRWRIAAPLAAILSLGLVAALTRGPWIGAAAGTVYLLWQWRRKSLLLLPVLAVAAFLLAPPMLRERVRSIATSKSERDSHPHRMVLWRTGVEMIKAHPWLGLGPEQVDKQFNQYVPADIPRPLPWGWYRHLHNIYLQYAAERGIPVLLAFLWLMGKVLMDFRRAARNRPPGPYTAKALLHGYTAALIAVLVAGLFEHNLGDSEMLQLFLALIAAGYAAAGAAVKETGQEPPSAQPAARS